MKRYTLTLGATTTAGGKVITASGRGSINGAAIALEGDAIYCPACKSNGKILCIGARIAENWRGVQIGLSGDLCTCGCRPLPRLSAAQKVRYQTLHDCHEATPTNFGPTQPQAHQTSSEENDALAIRFLGEHDGAPLALQPYRLVFTCKTIEGISDANSCTTPISAADRAQLIAWHVVELT
ncbi:PAAR domain-containing protein [Pseudoduganella danionis]|nr:PAAR domain-containing protein [Pseudoduganella danionis]